MRIFTLALIAFLTTSLLNSSIQADTITFDLVATDQITVGDSIEWQLFVTVSDYSPAPNNFGIGTVTASLLDGGGNTLTPGAIGAPFSDYLFTSGGTSDGISLIEIGAMLFTHDSGKVEALDPALGGTDSGPLLLASGSFTPIGLGTFDLTVSAGSTNTFFTAAGQLSGNGSDFTLVFNSDSYVVAVPEPIRLGDVNLDGEVNFLDISPFISVLSGGTYQAEADCNENGMVDFLDISPFIAILSGS